MAHNMSSMTPVERRQAANLWGRLLGIPLRVRTLDDVSPDSRLEARLLRGQVLVEQIRPRSTTVFSPVSARDRLVLTGEVEQLSEQLARATIYLLIDELIRYPEAEQPGAARRAEAGARLRLRSGAADPRQCQPRRRSAQTPGRRRYRDGSWPAAVMPCACSPPSPVRAGSCSSARCIR